MENQPGGENNSEENLTEVLDNCKINQIEDRLEKQIQSGFPQGVTRENIKLFIAGYLQSLEDFQAITTKEMDYLYSLYCA